MKRGHVISVVATCLVCVGALAGVLAANWKPLLGLDLRGGLSIIYCPAAKGSATNCSTAKVSQSKLDTAVTILEDRANAYGVSQPNINVQGNDVVVQLPGVKNARQVESQLGQTAQLYFRPVLCYAPAYAGPSKSSSRSATSSGKRGSSTGTSAAAYTPPPSCPSVYRPSQSNQAPVPYPVLAKYRTTPPQFDNPRTNVLLTEKGSSVRYLLGPAEASGSVIASATPAFTSTNQWVINFTLTRQGTPIWDNLANRNYHYLVADDLGGTVISAPVIQATGAQFGSSGEISGNFTQQSATALAVQLNYGALPITLIKQTTQIVSPTLGASSLRAGLIAGLVGLLLVMLYMIFYYRALGIVVVVGLLTTGALIYGIISALGHSSMQLTLDLSGITGLIVSVGITVDSYVVYFERLKDEVRAGRSIRASVDRGFKSAYRTILSADAVSFIGALVLWWLSVGAVRGFAFMLGLSTLIDVFTAYLFTRPLVILLGRNRLFTEARHLGVARGLAAAQPEEAAA
ncbi:MAG TPA: protein translocase subunit SecD [Acidimicrobiales bacterium]|nr:protein translocase subunit SecD [Acidimicrobiales bacterium]